MLEREAEGSPCPQGRNVLVARTFCKICGTLISVFHQYSLCNYMSSLGKIIKQNYISEVLLKLFVLFLA